MLRDIHTRAFHLPCLTSPLHQSSLVRETRVVWQHQPQHVVNGVIGVSVLLFGCSMWPLLRPLQFCSKRE